MSLEWISLTAMNQIEDMLYHSHREAVFVFKHSTTCGISAMALEHLELASKDTRIPFRLYYLDLLAHRDISQEIARKLEVQHQSPQIIHLKGGKVVFHTSHHRIGPTIIQDCLDR